MARLLIVAEHRQGKLRDATFELVTLARRLAGTHGLEPYAAVLGARTAEFAGALSRYLPEVVTVESPALENFRYETYAPVLRDLIAKETPLVCLAPHSAFGMELFPRLSAEIERPCATDVVEVSGGPGNLSVTRSVYSGKVNQRLSLASAGGYLLTVRSGSFAAAEEAPAAGSIRSYPCPPLPAAPKTEFVGYRESGAGEIDITQAAFILSVGRGIKDVENIPKAEALAGKLGAVLACSRPVVDKKWLGKERQVGTSGRTVKPKVYLALGISGAFQHLAGIKGSGCTIAVNRDPKAPIFRAADYGVVEDMFKVIDALREKLGS